MALAFACAALSVAFWLSGPGESDRRDALQASTASRVAEGLDPIPEHSRARRDGGDATASPQPQSEATAIPDSTSIPGLGPMPPGDEDVLRGDYLRALAMVRKERDELGGARDLHPADRAFEEGRITLREHALLAYLEMLDRDQYWVFATAEEQAAAEATLIKDVYTVTGGVGSSVERFLVLPLLRDRFPLYYRAAEDARLHLASVLDPLVREFNALPEEERRLIHRLRFQPSEWAGLSAATVELLRRYAARSILISKETFVARAKSLG